MSKNIILVVVLIIIIGFAFWNNSSKNEKVIMNGEQNINGVEVVPISHATVLLKWAGKSIVTDPVGSPEAYGTELPNIILVTDNHGDHFNLVTLKALVKENTTLVVPEVVADLIKETLPGTLVVMKNGEIKDVQGFSVEAIPMYNIPESKDAYHTKGRGNGYVIEQGDNRVYVSGDTSGTPEMKNLKDIDIAFVCMNLPYTMTVEEAAEAVLAFKPKQVIPYHYRGSDTNKFKELVNKGDANINVNLLNFYPQ